ncbi:MAG: 2-phosphoglycolate phosphatase [Porticoccus sp.]|jgi:2-phosphoglycolate phosphatase
MPISMKPTKTTSSTKFQAVLFDLDGTLLDTAPDFLTATNRLLERKGMPLLPAECIRRLVTHGSAGIIKEVFELEEKHPDFEPIRQELLTLYMANLADQTRPFQGITELLATLGQQHIPWGIVTNKPESFTLAILKQLPLYPAPSTIVCPDHVTKTKPDPESVILACQQLGVSPRESIYIGDHQRDIEAGLRAGTTTIAAAYGYIDDDENPTSWGAHYTVTSASQLLALIL